MKRSGMIKQIIIALIIITFLFGSLGGLAEEVLPSLTENTGIAMPSIAEALQRDPDSETENPDGSVTEYYANVSKQDYETFSVYLKEQGAVLADYKMEDNVLTAEIQANDVSFYLNYNIRSGEATVTYPAGTCGKKAQKAETQSAVNEQKGDSEQYKKIGATVTFGQYEQDNDLTNGPESIEWIVLDYDKKENKALLISKYGLDAFRYHSDWKNTTWEECTGRKWLNTVFLRGAFNVDEQKVILTTEVDNSHNQGHSKWKAEDRNNTQDQIFLLSFAEAERYFHVNEWDGDESNTESRAAPTAYAIAQGAPASDHYRTNEGKPAGPWWLRSQTYGDNDAANVTEKGSCRSDGVNMLFSVRPVIWLDLETLEELLSNAADEDPAEAERKARMAAYLRIGNTVTYGRYEQDNNLENGPESIEWIVLDYDETNNRSLLISKYGLDIITFAEWSTKHDCTWEDSIARKWLNQYFLYSAFSHEERKAIPVTEVDDSESQDRLRHEKRELQNTQDRIFLLSKMEAEIYLGVSGMSPYENKDVRARVAPTPYAIAQGVFVSDEFKTAEGLSAGTWLLRTYLYDCQGAYVNEGGTTDYYELESKRGGGEPRVARPAFWLDLNVFEGLLSSAEERKEDENPKEEESETKAAEYSRAGNIVTYGMYEQDNNLENGPEPIEWIVVTVDDKNNRAMLVSRYGLDIIQFDEWSTKRDVTWEDCRARKWLNQYFLYSAFSQEERKAIPVTEVDDSESQDRLRHEKKELQNTQDRIFLLSKLEARIYFDSGLGNWSNNPDEYGTLKARISPTPYAIARGAFVSAQFHTMEGFPSGQWLLRTYAGDCDGMTISQAGTYDGLGVKDNNSGTEFIARPAFWLDLETVAEVLVSSEEDKNRDENSSEEEHKAKVAQYSRPGNIVTFGHYEQDNDPTNGPEAIEWIVLTYDEAYNWAMLVSKYGLDVLEYHNVHRFKQQITWETCSAREWLNDTFLNTAFNTEEQKAILITELDNSDRLKPNIKLKGELNNTQDRIFLLSKTEAGIYFNLGERNEQTGSRIAPTPYAIAKDAFISGIYQTVEGLPAGQWWLRTPSGDYSDGMVVIQSGTYYGMDKRDNDCSGSLIVARPAIWLDLNADIF